MNQEFKRAASEGPAVLLIRFCCLRNITKEHPHSSKEHPPRRDDSMYSMQSRMVDLYRYKEQPQENATGL